MLASFVLYLESNKMMLSKHSQWNIIVNISETDHQLFLCSLYSPAYWTHYNIKIQILLLHVQTTVIDYSIDNNNK
jgi:hypothetical protein